MRNFNACQWNYDHMEAPSIPYDPLDELTFEEVWEDYGDEDDRTEFLNRLFNCEGEEDKEELLKAVLDYAFRRSENNLNRLRLCLSGLKEEFSQRCDDWTNEMIAQAKRNRADNY